MGLRRLQEKTDTILNYSHGRLRNNARPAPFEAVLRFIVLFYVGSESDIPAWLAYNLAYPYRGVKFRSVCMPAWNLSRFCNKIGDCDHVRTIETCFRTYVRIFMCGYVGCNYNSVITNESWQTKPFHKGEILAHRIAVMMSFVPLLWNTYYIT